MNARTVNDGIDVAETVAGMKPGDRKCYHIGHLLYDRCQDGPWSRMVGLTADAVYAMYQRGEVLLTQHRLGPCKFEYLMTRRVPAAVTRGGRRGGVARKPVQGSGRVLLSRPQPDQPGPVPDLHGSAESVVV